MHTHTHVHIYLNLYLYLYIYIYIVPIHTRTIFPFISPLLNPVTGPCCSFPWLLPGALIILQLMQLVISVYLAAGLKNTTTPQLCANTGTLNTHAVTLTVLCHTHILPHAQGFRISITRPCLATLWMKCQSVWREQELGGKLCSPSPCGDASRESEGKY